MVRLYWLASTVGDGPLVDLQPPKYNSSPVRFLVVEDLYGATFAFQDVCPGNYGSITRNVFGVWVNGSLPSAVMWMQSSMRTPAKPGT